MPKQKNLKMATKVMNFCQTGRLRTISSSFFSNFAPECYF